MRTRLLLTACGFSLAALAAIGGLLLLGLHRPEHQAVVFAPPKPQVRSAASVDRIAPATGAGQARRTAARRAEAIAAEPGGQARRTAARRADAIAASAHGGRLFSSTSIWNQRVAPSAPLDPSSGALVANLVAEVGRERTAGTGPLIQAGRASTPLYRVGAAQARVRVRLDDRQVPGRTALRRALAAVPIPANAKAGAKPNRYMSIWQPATDTLWELRGARKVGHEWHASWGGAMRKVSKNRGYYTPAAWRGATQQLGRNAQQSASRGGRDPRGRPTVRSHRSCPRNQRAERRAPACSHGRLSARTATAAYRRCRWAPMCASPPTSISIRCAFPGSRG